MVREVLDEQGVVVITTGSDPTTTRVWSIRADGCVGNELAMFQTFGRHEGNAQHANIMKRARAGEWSRREVAA